MASNNLAVDKGADLGSKVDCFRDRLRELQSMALELVRLSLLPKRLVTTISALPSRVREYISGLENLADEATRFAVAWPNQHGYRCIAAIVGEEIEEIKAMSQTDAKGALDRCSGMQKHYANQLSIQKAATTNFRTTGRREDISPGPRVQVYHHRAIFLEDLQDPSTFANYPKFLSGPHLVDEPKTEAEWGLTHKKAYECFDQIRLAEFYASQLRIENPCTAYVGLEMDIYKFRRRMERELKKGKQTARLVGEWWRVVDQHLSTIRVIAERETDQSQDLPEILSLRAVLIGLPDFMYEDIKDGVAELIVLHGQAQRHSAEHPNHYGFDSILRILGTQIDSVLRGRHQQMSTLQKDLALEDTEDSKAHFQSQIEHEVHTVEKEVERKKRLLVERKRRFDLEVAQCQAMRRASTHSLLSMDGFTNDKPDENYNLPGLASLETDYSRVRQGLALGLARIAGFNKSVANSEPNGPFRTDSNGQRADELLGTTETPALSVATEGTYHEPDSRNEVNQRRVGKCGNVEGIADIESAEEHCQIPEATRMELEDTLAHLEVKVARQAVILKCSDILILPMKALGSSSR
jgi:hypothetical protein